jgi:site-specific DNA-adenine methylase
MKNHFFISYFGNKRQEVEKIVNTIKDLDNIKTIVEPFCGTSALSYYISTLFPKKFKYILNDNNEHLIKLYKIAQDEELLKQLVLELNELLIGLNKEKYLKILKNNDLIAFILKNKIYKIRPGLYPDDNSRSNPNMFNLMMTCPIIHFLRNENIEFKNMCAIEVYNEYKTQADAYIFLDPPYLQACNDFYDKTNINIYEYLMENPIKKENAQIALCLEANWIIKMLFRHNTTIAYDKVYQTNKKKTTHIIITK